MKKISKLLAVAGLTLSFIITSGIAVFAWQRSEPKEGGTHTYGVEAPGNGYYMGFSYYYHPTKTHRSSVTVDGTVYRSDIKVGGYTSCINGPSTQSQNIGCYYSFV